MKPSEIQDGMQCSEFEQLLFDAIEGTLGAGKLAGFRAHASGCGNCGPLLGDVEAGQQLLRSLAEVDPPRNLVHNILARTTGLEERFVQPALGAKPSVWRQAFGWIKPVLAGTWATVRQPRFGMSMAMAFFSVSLVMSVAGIKVNDLAKLDLRPGAVKRSYYATQARVVKYYSNMRVVYEFESRLREIKRATEPAEGSPTDREREQEKERRNKEKENNKTSGRPSKGEGHNRDRDQDRNYAQDDSPAVMAKAGDDGANGLELMISATRREA